MASKNKISIDRKNIDNLECRYKMSEVVIKDGLKDSGKLGQRTIIKNLDDISNDLNRDPLLLICYLSSTFGCAYIEEKYDKYTDWILSGRYTKDKIQDCIYDFIDSYVLCKEKSCRKPETEFVKVNERTCLRCNACLSVTDINVNKTSNKIFKIIDIKKMCVD